MSADRLCGDFLAASWEVMQSIHAEEGLQLARAAERMADQIAADRLVHVFGPGGHSNLAAQEIFYRAGGLLHLSPILDEATLLSNGALRSTRNERTSGYGSNVIREWGLGATDMLLLVNAFGVNAAVIDAALEARERRVFTIGFSSSACAEAIPRDHVARHPSGRNLHGIVDIAIDTKIPLGDAVLSVPGMTERIGSISTFANSTALHLLVIRVVEALIARGIEPPVWRSRNAPGGDQANARFLDRFQNRVRFLK
jgi:uncharacterized phosphosugar-binding protein